MLAVSVTEGSDRRRLAVWTMNGPDIPLFTFVHAADPHWGVQTDPKFVAAPQRCACFLRDVAALQPRSRLLLIAGDLSSRGKGHPEELVMAEESLRKLNLPLLMVPGNHDLSAEPRSDKPQADLTPLAETNWYSRYGAAGLFWTCPVGPLEFAGFALRNGDPDGILDQLEAYLRTDDGKRRILMGHYPAYPVRTAGTLAKWGPHHIGDSTVRLQEILRKYANTVVAYLFGHVHVLSAQVFSGVMHASGGAVAVGAPGMRIFTVFPTGLESRFIPLSDPNLAEFAFWGGGHPEKASDADHPTSELYHMGTELERNFRFDFVKRTMQAL